MNPLAQIMGKQMANNLPIAQMMQQFQEFKQGWTPEAAQSKINEMLQSGQINAQQLAQAEEMAKRFGGMLK